MDRRTLLAIVLCFGIFLGWQKLVIEPKMQHQQQLAQQTAATNESAATQTQATAQQNGANAITPVTGTKQRPAQTLDLTTGTGTAQVSDTGKFFSSWNLKAYHQGLAADTAAVNLQTLTNQEGAVFFAADDKDFAYLSSVQGNLEKTATGAVWKYEDANVTMTREMVSPADGSQNYVDVTSKIEFKNHRPKFVFFGIAAAKPDGKDAEERDRKLIYYTNDSIQRVKVGDAELKQVPAPVRYVGTANRYFTLALVPTGDSAKDAHALIQPTVSGKASQISLGYPVTSNHFVASFKTFFGPKELTVLRSVDPALDHAVDFGFFTIIAYPLLNIIKWLYQFVHNYGIAIILLTVFLKIVLYPLTYKSMKSMRQMSKLQPQLARLREKYKDDKEALNREMMTLMRGNGYNPVAGCLPIFLQIPIFFALYQVLYGSIELYHAPFGLWIHDLSAHDPLYITPVLMTGLMWYQQKLTPNTTMDPMQARMLQFMPVLFGVFMLAYPAGLTIYMLVNSLASIIQQIILNKKLDLHVPAATANAR